MNSEFLFYTINDGRTIDAAEMTRSLISFATEFGLEGNIWQHWLTYNLMTDENPLDDLHTLRNVLMVMARGDLLRHPSVKRNPIVDQELDKFI